MTKIITDDAGGQFITTSEPGMVDAGWCWWWWKENSRLAVPGPYQTKSHRIARHAVFDVVSERYLAHGRTACGRPIPYGQVVYTNDPGRGHGICKTCARIAR